MTDLGVPDSTGLIRIDGVVEDIIYCNKENGYTVCDIEDSGGEPVTVTGILPYISEGDAVCFFGRWIHSPKYGRQFRAESFERELPADTAVLFHPCSSPIKWFL